MSRELGNSHSEFIVLDSVHRKALANLDSRLQAPREGVLRGHQIDVMQSVRDFLGRDESAGYIKRRFGLEGDPQTFDEIGKVYGVTHTRVRQIESKTMSQLRQPLRAGELREYLE